MCGIVAIAHNSSDVSENILNCLARLEYRGYDSSGIAVSGEDKKIHCIKAVGKIINLANLSKVEKISGKVGMGHTRWATHGKVCTENSHPHVSGDIAVVHNGIIENYNELKSDLISKGEKFLSETDTEVIPVMINHLMKNGMEFKVAFQETIAKLKGAYAIVAICSKVDNLIAIAKNHSPLVVGFGEGLSIIGSDAFSIVNFARKMTYLEDGDFGFVDSSGNLTLFDKNMHAVTRAVTISNLNISNIDKAGYKHYMMKEIKEQSNILNELINHYINRDDNTIRLDDFSKIDFSQINRLKVISCGTSYYAGIVGSYYFEKYSKMPTDCYIASEYRYRNAIVEQDTLYIAISQSGETADTIGAIKKIKEAGGIVISILNNEESTIHMLSAASIKCHAGPEICVASTKVFTSQVMCLLIFSLYISQKKGVNINVKQIYTELMKTAHHISDLLEMNSWDSNIDKISNLLYNSKSMLYLGRGLGYAIAMEGSLKLKELSYIHSEAIASGELKHGCIALIDKNMPCVVIAPSDSLFEKNASNIENVLSRNGNIVLISDAKGIEYFSKFKNQIIGSIEIPDCQEDSIPFLYSVAVQLLAYKIAVAKGNDIDQPRNLAKSVTVE